MFGTGLLLLLGAIWIVATALLARRELVAMKTDIIAVRHNVGLGNVDTAKLAVDRIEEHGHAAHDYTTGPVWWMAAHIPLVGAPLESVRGISAAADSLGSNSLPSLIDIAQTINPESGKAPLSFTNHKVDISPMVKITPALRSAVTNADRQQRLVAGLPHRTWFSAVDRATGEVDTALTSLVKDMDTVAAVVEAAPTLLGNDAPKRYFVGFQNESETRGSGGLPGAFGILVADHGTLTFTHFGSDSEIWNFDSGLDLGAEYNQKWRDFMPAAQYLNSTVDPDFRYAGQIWAALWEKKTGEHIDAALSLDPTALSYFLGATGPATLPDGSQVSAQNVVDLTQREAYSKFDSLPGEAGIKARKDYLLGVATAAERQVLDSGGSNIRGLFNATRHATDERRLLLWHSDPQIEKFLQTQSVGGAIIATKDPFVASAVINFGANKLDYYLSETIDWSAKGCGTSREVTVTIKLTNNAPTGLSPYEAARHDKHPYPVGDGDNRVLLHYIGTAGGALAKVTIDGQETSVASGTSNGHPAYSTLVEIPRTKTVTVVLNLREPGQAQTPTSVVQPMVTPVKFTAEPAHC